MSNIDYLAIVVGISLVWRYEWPTILCLIIGHKWPYMSQGDMYHRMRHYILPWCQRCGRNMSARELRDRCHRSAMSR
jgi:hypothetical protein